MKIRTGYVSNSSSSSFVVYGTVVTTFAELKRLLEKGESVVCVDTGGGTSGEAQDFVFNATPERIQEIEKKYRGQKNLPFYAIQKDYIVLEDDEEIDMSLPESRGHRLFRFKKDYSSPVTDGVDDEHFQDWLKRQEPGYVADLDSLPEVYGFFECIGLEDANALVDAGKLIHVYIDEWDLSGYYGPHLMPIDSKEKFNAVLCNPQASGVARFISSVRFMRNGEATDFPAGRYIQADVDDIIYINSVSEFNDFMEKALQ